MNLLQQSTQRSTLTACRKEHTVLSKKRIILLLAIASLAIAGIAGAYYSGSGTSAANANAANAGAAPQAVNVVVNSTAAGDLYPGDTASIPVSITSTHGAPRIGSLSFTVTPQAGCPAGSFSLPSVTVNAQTPVNTSGTLTFNDLPVSQDACAGAISITAQATP